MAETYKKIDENTVEITTTIPEKVTKIERDRAELQTELDHLPDRLMELQKQMDSANKEKQRLINILDVFKTKET